MEEKIYSLISFSGEAKSLLMEVIQLSKKNKFKEANEKLNEAKRKLSKAHNVQTQLIQKEAAGEQVESSLLLVHAQDHLMNALMLKDLAAEFSDIYKKIESKN